MLQIQSKRFYLDVKQNRRGRFIRVAEVSTFCFCFVLTPTGCLLRCNVIPKKKLKIESLSTTLLLFLLLFIILFLHSLHTTLKRVIVRVSYRQHAYILHKNHVSSTFVCTDKENFWALRSSRKCTELACRSMTSKKFYDTESPPYTAQSAPTYFT